MPRASSVWRILALMLDPLTLLGGLALLAPGVDPSVVVRTAVDSLGLRPPTPGVGAYVYLYPDYEEWGLSWWVGAPLWLWVDSSDPLIWGTHHLSASEGGMSVDMTVRATSVAYDPGDGSGLVVCTSPGTPRPWDPDALMADTSPCQHRYQTKNTPGDIDSRFTVSATVTWDVTWASSDGRTGQFAGDIPSTANPTIHVGELRVVTVPND